VGTIHWHLRAGVPGEEAGKMKMKRSHGGTGGTEDTGEEGEVNNR